MATKTAKAKTVKAKAAKVKTVKASRPAKRTPAQKPARKSARKPARKPAKKSTLPATNAQVNITGVAAVARKRLKGKQAAEFAAVLRQYFRHVPPQDIAGRPAEDVFAAANSHWKLGATRRKGKAAINVYSPARSDVDAALHTVVEVITDDMPFLVDSLAAEFNRQGLTVHLVIHPVIKVLRDAKGKRTAVLDPGTADAAAVGESYMYFEVTEQAPGNFAAISKGVEAVIKDVRFAVADWRQMRLTMNAVIEEMDDLPASAKDADSAEAREFLQWIHDNHFTFLGFREYNLKGAGAKLSATVNQKSGLGVLRDPKRAVFQELRGAGALTQEVRAFAQRKDLLLVSKTNTVSAVHRPVHMDVIGIKRLDAAGRVTGYLMFVGLFTSGAYSRSASEIPMLRQKLKNTIRRAGFPASSHDGKALANILETYPRDELFQASEDQLLEAGLGILHLQERQRVALFVRRDDFDRFMSCLVFVPRDRYTTELRHRLQAILEKTFAGRVTAEYSQLDNSPLARWHLIVQTDAGKVPAFNHAATENLLAETARSWSDHLEDALVAAHGEAAGLALFDRYRTAFPAAYAERYSADEAVADVARIDGAIESGDIGMKFYRPAGAGANDVSFKIYRPGNPVALSDILPMLEDLGLKVNDELPYAVSPNAGTEGTVMIHDFGLTLRAGGGVDPEKVADKFNEAFHHVWHGRVESDGFNALVLGGGLAWRQVVVLRAFAKYLRQAGIPFSQDYMEQTLANNPGLARRIVDLFDARFDPSAQKGADARVSRMTKAIHAGLEEVASADEDRILRRFLNLVEAMLRTNFFQKDAHGGVKSYVSFKFDSHKVDGLPLPRPLREIFVYSPKIEGVHLRFGLVARGGLRWSDRREDFRTEILGLVKAQQVKNAVIVPVGSKGGFVVKRPPTEGGRDAFMAEGISCYQTFISGLLDITDNLDGNRVIPPKRTVRLDGNDPYLVVAADKGTATFSDIANAISTDYGFWLGDAFASGGSIGYDHKKMGITARGGWESVKRHFREMGVNTQKEAFDVVGVGDMSGDVFGNGMLLSPHIRLIAAFNHLHIFVDPDPDPASTFMERKRMFKLPRSNWTDFNAKLMSKGAAIYERSAKSLKLTPEIRKRFDLDSDTVTPNVLLNAILKAEADLLWFGGIGTYVKATTESDLDAGDRANDMIRVNATELRCKVVGEGANLGVTQRARVEFALGGGRINTDSIDNSAGVDCSDHEVNIKILLDQAVAAGSMTFPQRNTMLAKMTKEVGLLVLRDNYLQTLAMTLIQSQGGELLDNQIRLMRMLERSGRLNREVEFLPDDETLGDRAAQGKYLTRPEISVLMSYSKIWLYDELLQSNLPDDDHLADEMITYFPTLIQKTFRKLIGSHRLRREIVATRVTNSLINRTGASFVPQMMEKTGMLPSDIARAYTITRIIFNLGSLWKDIEALDNKVSANSQIAILHEINRLVERVTQWLLRNGSHPMDIGSHVKEFEAGISALMNDLDKALPKHYEREMKARARPMVEEGVPEALAQRIAGLINLVSGCDIVRLATAHKMDVATVANLYFAVGSRFRLGRLRAATEGLEAENHWQKVAVNAMIEELYSHQLALTAQVLEQTGARGGSEKAIDTWADKNRVALERTESLLAELYGAEITDFSVITVASRQLSALIHARGD